MLDALARYWDEAVLPWATDRFTPMANRFRREILAAATGRVLEVGIGSGPSLAYYPAEVTEVVGMEPNAGAAARLRRRLRRQPPPFPVVHDPSTGPEFAHPDASFDAVSFQLVLCTLPEPARALAEARRVLKPGGKLLFVEHVRHSHPRVARFQDRIAPLWARCMGGCRVDQDTVAIIATAGFALDWVAEAEDEARPRFLSHVVWGVGSAGSVR